MLKIKFIMKMIYYATVICLIFQVHVVAQQTEFAPVGAYWKYNWFDMTGEGEEQYQVVSDTVVGGQRNGSRKCGTDQLVENIGLLKTGFLWLMYDCSMIEEAYSTFLCYKSGNFSYPANQNCILSVGTEESLENQVVVNPNPAQTFVQVTLPDRPLNIQLMNGIGQSQSVPFIGDMMDVSLLANGVYFLIISSDNQRVTKKVFVQH